MSSDRPRRDGDYPVPKARFDFDHHLPYVLARTANLVLSFTTPHYLAEIADAAQLSVREFRVLVAVAKYPPLSPAAAAERTGMDRATVTRALAGLQRLRLVRTLDNKQDKRGKYMVLTESGAALCDRLFPLMKAQGKRLSATLSPDERDTLLLLLGKLSSHAAHLLQLPRQTEDD